MAKVKFTLAVSPTFKSTVIIPAPGGKSAPIEFTFKHRTRDAFKEFTESLGGRDDVDVLLDIASGWDLDEPFDKETVEQLTQNYLGAGRAVAEAYINELTAARVKN